VKLAFFCEALGGLLATPCRCDVEQFLLLLQQEEKKAKEKLLPKDKARIRLELGQKINELLPHGDDFSPSASLRAKLHEIGGEFNDWSAEYKGMRDFRTKAALARMNILNVATKFSQGKLLPRFWILRNLLGVATKRFLKHLEAYSRIRRYL